jgi:hypothetical protein
LSRLLNRGAVAAGLATEQWTLERIAALIEREFGVHYHPRYLESPLKAHGFSVQRPATRAKERDELVIAVWPKRDWGTLKKARREHRTQVLWDETGHSFRIRRGTTWARRGLTPVLQRVSKRCEVSSIVAITPDGRLYASHFCTSISSRCVIQVLRYVRRRISTPLLVVWDRLNAHRSRATSAFIAAHPQDYAAAYTPELNPEEQCDALVKPAMAKALPGSVDDLHRLARRELGQLKRHPEMIVRFLRHAGLSVTGLT